VVQLAFAFVSGTKQPLLDAGSSRSTGIDKLARYAI
jgi:hypothetical protein